MHQPQDRAQYLRWARALQDAIDSTLPEPRNPRLHRPQLTILDVSANGTHFELEIRFQAGKTYCCVEPGCYLSTYSRDWWASLRQSLAAYSDRTPPPLSISIQGVVEEGVTTALPDLPPSTHTTAFSYRHGPRHEKNAK